jgi:hypothetical protein
MTFIKLNYLGIPLPVGGITYLLGIFRNIVLIQLIETI